MKDKVANVRDILTIHLTLNHGSLTHPDTMLETSVWSKNWRINFGHKSKIEVLFSDWHIAEMFRQDRPPVNLPRVFREATLRVHGPIFCIYCNAPVVSPVPWPLLDEVNEMAHDTEEVNAEAMLDRFRYCNSCHTLFRDNLF